MVIAAVERQSFLLFEKILSVMVDKHKKLIMTGSKKPTKHVLRLKNGSVIHSLPCGLTGYGLRGFTIDLLIADEAAFIPDLVWDALTPALAITRGKIWLLSTPFGRQGYFYERFNDDSYTKFHVSSESCPRADHEFLAREKASKTKMVYAQEYLGEFVDELRQFFPTDILEKVLVLDITSSTTSVPTFGDTFCGVDVARLGRDDTAIFSLNRTHRERLTQICPVEVTNKTLLTETIRRIKRADKRYRYKAIYIDTTGVGAGVFDVLLEDPQTKRKVVSIDNAMRSIDMNDRRSKILKEDLYSNLLRLMESRDIVLYADPEIMLSLKSVQYEYSDNGRIKIFGNDTHIAEALVRAAWCIKDKRLSLWCR